jgi:hypothetical protein
VSKADDKKYGEELNCSTPRAVAANLLESANVIGAGMDVNSAVKNGTDRKGRPMTTEQAVFKLSTTALAYTPLKFIPATNTSRVFWSGGNSTKTVAADFAANNAMTTLEMTTTGRIMDFASSFLPKSITTPISNKLSTNFSKGALGEATVFTSAAGPRATSIWLTLEKPILEQKGVTIITRILP